MREEEKEKVERRWKKNVMEREIYLIGRSR